MGESEILDLFPDSNSREGRIRSDEIGDDGYHYNGRSRINDYKHTTSSIHRTNEPVISRDRYHERFQEKYPQKKSYINVSDERIVWAGAIFVFFGVFIFLVGYWLGKTTLKDIAFGNRQDIQKIEDRSDQTKMENNSSFNNLPQVFPKQEDNTKNENNPEKNVKALVPGNDGTNLVKDENLPENLTTPPVKNDKKLKSEPKNVKLKLSSEKPPEKNKNSEKKQKSTNNSFAASEGKYTIQVSAHTSMEKAREVENNLRSIGLESYLVEANVNGIIYYRVRVGKFTTKEDAAKAIEKIKGSSLGKESMILNLQ